LVSSRRFSQYDIVFRIANCSQGHANIYIVKTKNCGTLIITGQIADRSEGVRVLENDHYLASAFGRIWLLRNAQFAAARGDIHYFTACMDSGELVPTWRKGEVRGWKPFPDKLKYVSQIEDRFDVILSDYRGACCAKAIPEELAALFATSINCPKTSISIERPQPTNDDIQTSWTHWLQSVRLWTLRISCKKEASRRSFKNSRAARVEQTGNGTRQF
jgi:hypothetical protein